MDKWVLCSLKFYDSFNRRRGEIKFLGRGAFSEEFLTRRDLFFGILWFVQWRCSEILAVSEVEVGGRKRMIVNFANFIYVCCGYVKEFFLNSHKWIFVCL